ncbi:MAG: hypothetical protein A3G25_21015 [Betaproteobacteria bacterium RIFCSPLOWO2_12_FULL_63_13]|nr:MAG: hypothetical protein A3G25_21015 [Betaproteobacteria bacterium RIFCSPLOWO2_12_FULL_63_13]
MQARIGKFELKKLLGKGASGKVYLAFDTFNELDVALKVLDPAVVSGEDVEKTHMHQFLNEASLAGKLSHPHIASILEASVNSEPGYIALEYVPGGDLTQYTDPVKLLRVEDAIEIAFKCCGALDYAFKQGIVHRDIKPANIMVVSGTDIKVADFGAAFLHRAQATQITDIGSPLYMSPEQIKGDNLGHQSDMFALGVVLYELFTGQRPFVATTLSELFKVIMFEQPEAPSARRPELNKDIDRILLKMLSKSPADRYASWADLALELADIGRLSVYHQQVADSEKFIAMRRIPVLQILSDAEIWEMVHTGRWSRIPPRKTIIREGQPGSTLCFLASGEVKITKQGKLLNILGSGEYFGEMGYVKNGEMPRHATVESTTDVLLAEFEPDALEKVSTGCRLQLTVALLHAMVDRLALADSRLVRA